MLITSHEWYEPRFHRTIPQDSPGRAPVPKRALRDKADIQALIEANEGLDWQAIKRYADMFDEWPEISRIRSLVKAP